MELDFPSNSGRPNPKPTVKKPEAPVEPKKIVPVVTGEVIRRPKAWHKRWAEKFFGEDVGSVWAYVAGDVLLPAAKDMVADAVTGGVNRMVFGDNERSLGRRTHRSSGGFGGNIPYDRYSRSTSREPSRREEPRRQPSSRTRSVHDFGEIVLESRVQAQEVLERMHELTVKYEAATVANLYELCGITPSFTDEKWGWFNVRDGFVSRTRGGGYLLELPSPEPLD